MSFFQALLMSGAGTSYYVASAGTGNGLSTATPMSTADFLALVLADNDRVFFNRGDTFEVGDFSITADNITISTYGSGADPILRGGVDISGLTWTDTGGGIYTASVAVEPKWIWIAGICAKNAETARVTVSARGTATTATVPNATLDAYTSIVDAYVVIKEKNFQNSVRRKITNFNKTTDIMTFDGNIATNANVDLVCYNDPEFLSGNNEWAWNGGTLYVKAAASPSTLNIRKSDYTYCIKSTGSLTVDNIEFKEYYTSAIWTNHVNGIVDVSDCSFHDIRDVAILLERATLGSQITNNTFLRIGNNGVLTRPATDMVVTGNTFTDIGMQDNYGWQTWSTGPLLIGVQLWYSTTTGCAFAYEVDFDDDTIDGANLLFDQNTISNVAYCGLNMGLGTTNTITRNVVSDFVNRFQDGGGLYFFHYRAYDIPSENNEIANNLVSNNNNVTNTFAIYMDNRTRLSNIHHNTLYDCNYLNGLSIESFSGGILLNYDTETHTVENNNIYNCDLGIIFRQSDDDGSFLYVTNENNQNNNNVIATKQYGDGQFPMMFKTSAYTAGAISPYTGTGGADNNIYNTKVSPFYAAYNEEQATEERTLAQLKTDYSEDTSSINPQYIADLVVNPTAATSNEDGQSNYKDLATGSTITTYTIDPYFSRIIGRINFSNQLVAASSQYYNAGTAADIQFSSGTGPFSISFWFKAASNPAAAQIIISNQDSSSRGWGVVLLTTGAIQLNLINTVATNRRQYATSADIADNAWHHVLIVVQDSSPEIYVDGGGNTSTLVANNLSATIASTADLLIGATFGPSLFADILIDDVAIWDSDQTANRTAIYNGGFVQDLTRRIFIPLHYWRMGNASDLLDAGSSESPLNLTGVNSPTVSTDVKN